MPASSDFLQEYQHAEAAYTEGNYEEAAALVYQLVENYPEDPSARLLCGHIYGYGLQQFDVAKEQYLAVLELSDEPELIQQAHEAMSQANQYMTDSASYAVTGDFGQGLELEDEDELVDAQTQLDFSEQEAETDEEYTDLENLADYGDTRLESDLDLEELSGTDLASSPLDADLDLDNIDLSQSQLNMVGLDSDAGLDLEGLDLDEADLELEDLSGDLQLEELNDLDKSRPDSAFPPDTAHSVTTGNPFSGGTSSFSSSGEGQALDEDITSELPQEDDGAIATQFDSDPFQLDDEPILEAIEPEHLSSIDTNSEDFLDSQGNYTGDTAPTDLEEVPSDDSFDSDEAFDIDDIMNLGEFETESVDHRVNDNGRPEAQQQPVTTESYSQSPSNVENTDLDEFNSDLDEIFQSLEDSADLRFHSSDIPEMTSSMGTEANGQSYMIPDDLEESSQNHDHEAETLLMGISDSTGDDFQIDEDSGFTLEEFSLDPQPEIDEPTVQTDPSMGESSSPAEFATQNGNKENNLEDSEGMFDASAIPDSFGSDAFENSSFGDVSELSEVNGATRAKEDEYDLETDSPSEVNTDFSRLDDDDFLDNFDEFDDFGNVPDFATSREEESAFISDSSGFDEGVDSDFVATASSALDQDSSAISNDELFNVPLDQEVVTTFTSQIDDPVETHISVEQGPFAFLENKIFKYKFLYMALGTGVSTLIFVAVTTNIMTQNAAINRRGEVVSALRKTGWIVTAAAGVTSFLSAWGLGNLASRQMSKASLDLQHQFDSIARNNLKARATVYATDELGLMAAKFNHMAQFIETTTVEAQRKAEEQEEAKENLQRQVIRLLDDVEGAARGDLTVTAEVTADVLGAVADSFNLTIQNLREIVVQVKQAARQVSKGATDSSTFAKDVAGDALRQAEELAATLNSVQVLTDAIQRVADSAREAEEVARSAAAVATKGGEAVQMTVAGILKIRETVAETTREVKRLAESSQEISKIVAIISQIASRTNLLALNASIEAARAGEAGRGFAIVADEVRQLADRSAKSLKEIEQIVMQIQSQTNSVMMAMEEGNQQVIDGTRLAEQAKRSLDDIIQVTNRIDVLVRSITADTVEQNETARAVAQVMQAVEHSAQETSQEAHRVSNALSNLVGVARDLLTSVERFRVDASERK
ncbi:MAG: methyl-accepting chemotaxis protein [Cyanobacteriota bacterium]|nr:methyl-accepting chemotaxis protein [Cyanobacteriota bacterium]